MTRLEVVIPISGLSEAEIEQRRTAISALAAPTTDVRIDVLADGPSAVETRAHESAAVAAIRRHVRERALADGRRFGDAIAIWCAGDPGVAQARALCDVPVIGPGAASYHVARLAASRFGVVCPLQDSVARVDELLAETGFADRCVGVGVIGIGVLDLRRDVARTLDRIQAAARPLIADGAEALVLGCMGLFGLADDVAARAGLPVIDPMAAAIGSAELVGRLFAPPSAIAAPAV